MHVPNYIDNLDEISVADKIWNSNFHFSPWPQGSKSSKPKENNNNHIIVTMTRLHIGNLWSNKWIIILGANKPPGQPLTHLVSELVCLTQLCWVRIIDEPTTNRSTRRSVAPVLQFCSFIHWIHPSIICIYLDFWLHERQLSFREKKEESILGSHHPCDWLCEGCAYVGGYACGFMFTESMRRVIATMPSSKSWTRHWNWQPSIPIPTDNVLCHFSLLQCGWI